MKPKLNSSRRNAIFHTSMWATQKAKIDIERRCTSDLHAIPASEQVNREEVVRAIESCTKLQHFFDPKPMA
ncbi:MAG: hypothetical protein ABI747_02705 [Candidatus Moraniibacteriota bacterium]